MPRLLRDRFAVECIREFDLAATERYVDAMALAQAGRRTGAVYLYGYVVEMLLKVAYFRVLGFGDADPINRSAMQAAVGESPASTARVLGLNGTRNLHNIDAWSELLVTFRRAKGLLYPDPGVSHLLITNVSRVGELWAETVRYHKNTAYGHELARVENACQWLVEHRYDI